MALENVYFHIGSPKTGTSVLQSHLQQNRKVLRDKGVFYPSTISPFAHLYWSFESHHLLTYSWAGWAPYTDYSPARFFDRAHATCERYGMHTMLLSAENSYWLPTQIISGKWPDNDEYWAAKRRYVERIHDDLKHYKTKIVVYLRRQDTWLETWFNQWIKNGTHISEDIYPTFADRHEPLLNHAKHIEVWSDVFGRENMIIRPYEDEQLPDGLLQSFLSALNLGLASEYPTKTQPRYNAHLDRDTMELMNLCNSLPLDREDSVWLRLHLRKVTGQFERQVVFREQSLLSPDERNDLLDRYDASNAWVAKTFLDREDGVLFMAPRPDSGAEWQPYPGLPTDHAARLIVSMLFARGGTNGAMLSHALGKSRQRLSRTFAKTAAAKLPQSIVAHLEQRLWDKYIWGDTHR